MHIWYIEHYGGGPGIGVRYRPYHLGRAWRSQGHSATVFIARFHHLLEGQRPLERRFEVDGVGYVTVPARHYSENGLSRIINMWEFSANLYSVGRDLPPPDVVIASSPHPFVVFPGNRLARRHGAKFVYEIRDLWPLSITEIQGVSRFHPFVQICAFAERYALRRSDLVASVLLRADRYLASGGYSGKPFAWVPNGIDANGSRSSSDLVSEEARIAAAKLAEWRSQGRVNIIYTGALGQPNAIDLLLQAAAHGGAVGCEGKFGVLVVGKGEQQESLRLLVQDKNLPNVHLSGSVPKSDAIALLKSADIGYAGLRNIASIFQYGISPNKIADYFNASLPVVLPIAPCGDPVSESGGGIARVAETPEVLWHCLSELILLSPEERQALGEKGKNYMTCEYDYDRIARKYIEAIVAS